MIEHQVDTQASSAPTAFVGRQPILQRDLQLYAYELLFRDGDIKTHDANAATANVVINSLLEIGLDNVAGSARVFVNVTRDLLVHGDMSCLPPERFVLEVLEDVHPDAEVVQSIRRLAESGYTIALDDYVHNPELKPLIELADIIKLDLPLIQPDQLEAQIRRLVDSGVRVLAEKVETHEQFQQCSDYGCELFQGFFFCRPQLVGQRKLGHDVTSLMRLLSELCDPEISPERIESLLATDAALSYRLLRYVNSASVTTAGEINDLRHAATVVGVTRIRSLASMMLMSELAGDKPAELMHTAMIRAKACEALSRTLRQGNPDQAFTVGMVSVFDAMLDTPMPEVVKRLPLAPALNRALVEHSGDLGEILSLVLSQESGEWLPNAPIALVQAANAAATIWLTSTTG